MADISTLKVTFRVFIGSSQGETHFSTKSTPIKILSYHDICRYKEPELDQRTEIKDSELVFSIHLTINHSYRASDKKLKWCF